MSNTEIVDIFLKFLGVLLSWPVIILIVVLFFRDEIRALLKGEKIEKIETPFGKIKFSKIVDTPLGKMELSGLAVKTNTVGLTVLDGIQETYVGDNFLISWPSNSWSNNEEDRASLQKSLLSSTQKLSIVIMKNEKIDNFNPNINVIVDFVGNLSISHYIDQTIKQMEKFGSTVMEPPQIYEDLHAGFIHLHNDKLLPSIPLRQFQKTIIVSGRAYVVTASIAHNTIIAGNINISKELMDILNSFRLMI